MNVSDKYTVDLKPTTAAAWHTVEYDGQTHAINFAIHPDHDYDKDISEIGPIQVTYQKPAHRGTPDPGPQGRGGLHRDRPDGGERALRRR